MQTQFMQIMKMSVSLHCHTFIFKQPGSLLFYSDVSFIALGIRDYTIVKGKNYICFYQSKCSLFRYKDKLYFTHTKRDSIEHCQIVKIILVVIQFDLHVLTVRPQSSAAVLYHVRHLQPIYKWLTADDTGVSFGSLICCDYR